MNCVDFSLCFMFVDEHLEFPVFVIRLSGCQVTKVRLHPNSCILFGPTPPTYTKSKLSEELSLIWARGYLVHFEHKSAD